MNPRAVIDCRLMSDRIREREHVPDRALRGILPVLQIPFTAGHPVDTIDEAALRREVEFCLACGVHGLVVPALASEFMVLTDDERRFVVETVVAQTAGRVPVVANVAAPSANAAIAFACHAREHGADAVMALPPYVRRPTMDAVLNYYAAIAEAAQLPVVIQNAPPPFGISLPTPVVLRLVDEIDGVSYIKEERLPAGRFMSEALAAGSPRLRGILGGSAGLYLPGELQRGAIGCMPSAAMGDVLVAVYDASMAGDTTEARAIHRRALPLLNLEMSAMMAVSKEVLRRRGVFTSTLMRDPEFGPLDAGDLAELDAIWPDLSPLFAI
jgi:4-hydroxy-tetrahydrodipicolinate synthase